MATVSIGRNNGMYWMEGIDGDRQVVCGGSVDDIMRYYRQRTRNRVNTAAAPNNPRDYENVIIFRVLATLNGWSVRSTTACDPEFTQVDGRMTITVRVSSGIGNLRGQVLPGNSIKWILTECDKPDQWVTIKPPANVHVDSLECDLKDGVFKVWQT